MMFSASRSRRLQIVPIIQSFAQLEKNYDKEGSEIIIDNTQLTIFGGFAPNSSSADVLSKALGSRTVMSGSVNRGKDNPSESLQMIERPLMTPDELKSLPKGTFIVMKTGAHPMKVKLKLFFKWGIEFEDEYKVPEQVDREVAYACKDKLKDAIAKKYKNDSSTDEVTDKPFGESGGAQIIESEKHFTEHQTQTDAQLKEERKKPVVIITKHSKPSSEENIQQTNHEEVICDFDSKGNQMP